MCTNEVSHYQVLNEGELLPARDIGATPKKTVVQQGGGDAVAYFRIDERLKVWKVDKWWWVATRCPPQIPLSCVIKLFKKVMIDL